MLEVESSNDSNIFLRHACSGDARMFFKWRNDPWIIAKGRSGNTVSWDEHKHWFGSKIAGSDALIFVILVDHEPSGALFFFKDEAEATISLYLLKHAVGRSIGPKVIKSACAHLFKTSPEIELITAEILPGNTPSVRGFEKSGFLNESSDEDVILMTLRPGAPENHIPHNRISFGQNEADAAFFAVDSGMWVGGNWTRALESRLRTLTNREAICVDSGYSALRLALKAAGVEKGDEVIVPAYSCVALPNSVLSIGAVPVSVDVSLPQWNLSVDSVAKKISCKTKAVIAVNTFGKTAPCREISEKFGVCVIEDCSHGFDYSPEIGIHIRGDIAITSFYATKLIGCGMGGAVWTASSQQSDIVLDLRSYVDRGESALRINGLMSEMEAAIAYRQLDRLAGHLEKREKLASRYRKKLNELQEAGLIQLPEFEADEVIYRFPVLLSENIDRDRLQSKIEEENVVCEIPVEPWGDWNDGDFQNSEIAYTRILSLPLYPGLSFDELDRVAEKLTNNLNELNDEQSS